MAQPPTDIQAKLRQMAEQERFRSQLKAQYEAEMAKRYNRDIVPFAQWMSSRNAPGMAGGGDVSVTQVKKRKDDKIPELETAAKALLHGLITRVDYDKVVSRVKPVKPYESIPRPANDEEALGALHESKRPKWRLADQWEPGRRVGLRLDIPAYSDHGVWVNSIHDEENGGVAYGPVSSVKNAVFDPGASKAQRVATGEANKSPFAKIKGEWNPMSDDDAKMLAP